MLLKTLMLVYLFVFQNNPSQAQNVKQVKIDEAIEIAIQNNSNIKASNANVLSAQALTGSAFELPKLNLSMQLGQYSSPKFDQAFQVEQSIPFPTIFAAQKNKIYAEVRSQECKNESAINQLKLKVRTEYNLIQYLQHNKIRLQYLDSLYAEFIRVATIRFDAGDIKKIEISSAETQRGEMSLLLAQNEVSLTNAIQNFNTTLNSSEPISVAYSNNYQPLKIADYIDSSALAVHPEIRILEQEVNILSANQQVEKAAGLPEFTVGYNNQSLIGLHEINGAEKYFNAGNRFHVFNVGIAIPLTWGATKSKIKSLAYQKQAAELLTEGGIQQLNAQLKNELQQYQLDQKQYQYYILQAIPNADAIVTAAQVGYRAGEISYVEYLYALQTATDIELKYLSSIQKLNQTVININALINN